MTPSGQRRGASRKARSLVIEPECLEDLRWWVDTNRKTALRVFELIEAVMLDPFSGIGKPEHLKLMGPNIWSRRITGEDRLVYLVSDDRVNFLQARFHY
jgi:toxin YoeB